MPLDTILADLKTQGNYRRLKTLTHEEGMLFSKEADGSMYILKGKNCLILPGMITFI